MGNGRFDEDDYLAGRAHRAAAAVPDFAHTVGATSVHPTLNPMRIVDKPFGKLESRDSTEHPISVPIIITFDVTGSNVNNARIAQQQLPALMNKLMAVCNNPQVAIWANDDTRVVGRNAIQMSDFESDNRIDDSIRNIWLTADGGGNGGESYDLLIYAAARKTVTDSLAKRGEKGIMILYADENFFPSVRRIDVKEIFGDVIEADIPIGDIVAEAQKKWEINVLWPGNSGASQATHDQYQELFGVDNVYTLESPEALCDTVAGLVRKHVNTSQSAVYEDDDYVNRLV
jgi:hypothetical protein